MLLKLINMAIVEQIKKFGHSVNQIKKFITDFSVKNIKKPVVPKKTRSFYICYNYLYDLIEHLAC